jgi:hypothetical protein
VKRKPTSTHGKPALDGRTFQQVLAAVYVLQEHHDRLLETGLKADCAALSDGAEDVRPIQQMVPPTPESVAVPAMEQAILVAQAEVEPLAPQYDSVIPPETAYQLSVLASQLEVVIQQQIRTDCDWTTRLPVAVARESLPARRPGQTAWRPGCPFLSSRRDSAACSGVGRTDTG